MKASDISSIQETTSLIALGLGLLFISLLLRKKFSKRQAGEAFRCEEDGKEPSAGGAETSS